LPVGCGDSPKLPEQSSEVLTFRTLGGRLGLDGVPTYLVETFLSRNATRERTKRERRARSAAEELTGAGIRVRFERSIHVPEDEICFFLVDAASGREAALVAEQAALEPIRVVEAVSSRKEWQ
jgi:hypothetical protein